MQNYFLLQIIVIHILTNICILGQNVEYNLDKSPKDEIVTISLAKAKLLLSKKNMSNRDILEIYYSEIYIGKYVLGIPLNADEKSLFDTISINGVIKNKILVKECLHYINEYRNRFTEVEFGLNNESPYWEPSNYWSKIIKKKSPDCQERKEIEFDIDFKNFIRQFDIDERSWKNCEEFYKYDLVSENGNPVNESKRLEVEKVIKECKEMRKKFTVGKKKLLKKYSNASFTDRLKNIDPSHVIIYVSFNC